MVEADYARFSEWFDVLAVTHRLQGSEDMRGKMKAEYFDVLRSYPFRAVESAYQTLRRKMKKWPVPADWLEALPPFGSVTRLPLMTDAEADESDEAERLGYERDEFCHCALCERGHTTHLKSRCVPRLDANGHELERQHPRRQGRPVLLGRWIHSDELRRWAAARGAFYEQKDVIGQAMQLEQITRRSSPELRLKHLETQVAAKIAEGG
jgi:hypothetical protein